MNKRCEINCTVYIAVDADGDGWVMKADDWFYDRILEGNYCGDNGLRFPKSDAGLYVVRTVEFVGDGEGGLLEIIACDWQQIAAIPTE